MEELIELARTVPGPNGKRRAIDDDEIARRLALARAEVEAHARDDLSLALSRRAHRHAGRRGVDDPALLLRADPAHRPARHGRDRRRRRHRLQPERQLAERVGRALSHRASRRRSAAAPRRSSATSSASACSACRAEETADGPDAERRAGSHPRRDPHMLRDRMPPERVRATMASDAPVDRAVLAAGRRARVARARAARKRPAARATGSPRR